MTQPQTQNQNQLVAGFNYADLSATGNYLQQVKLEENKPVLLSFLNVIPGMQSPPIVYCKVHWNSEMGEKGTRFQCFGGQCCEQVTWQKGWGGQPGKFAPNKASTRYYIPCVTYEPDPTNQTKMKAVVKYIEMSWTAYNSFIFALKNTEGTSFFERDVIVTAKKVNGAMDYIFDRREGQAQWIINSVFKQQVEEQLPLVPEKFLQSLPKMMTESEFLALKPTLDAKVQAAMNSHNNPQVNQPTPQAQFGSLPQGFVQPQNVQQAFTQSVPQFTQPQVNIPVTPQVVVPQNVEQVQPIQQPTVPTVPQFTQPQVNIPVQTPVVETVVPQVENVVPQTVQPVTDTAPVVTVTPQVTEAQKSDDVPPSLDFDPSALLK